MSAGSRYSRTIPGQRAIISGLDHCPDCGRDFDPDATLWMKRDAETGQPRPVCRDCTEGA